MTKKVAIIGGGIGGLTVAHELAERGDFDITIYEKATECGGKAKSVTTKEGYPAEHSIRTIAITYYHFRDTLKRIPLENNKTVLDHVAHPEAGSRKFLMFKDHDCCILPAYFPFSPSGYKEYFKFFSAMAKIVPYHEMLDFNFKLVKSASMCPARAMATLEKLDWNEYIDSKNKSRNFCYYLHRLPEFYVAAKGTSNARSMSMLVERSLFLPIFHPIGSHYSSLDFFVKPTSQALINPWVDYLKKLGVKFSLSSTATEIGVGQKTIDHIVIKKNDRQEKIVADIYVFAVPVEVMREFVEQNKDLKLAAPSLTHLDKLSTEESSGLQLYFEESLADKFPRGWIAFLDSPWSIIGFYQENESYQQGTIKSTLTLTWSNFDEPGALGKPARKCTAEEIKNDILAQIYMTKGLEFLRDVKIAAWYVDHEIEFSANTGVMVKHHAPLFIQLANSFQDQPEAYTEINNLFLAAEYVRTTYDLATMEAANEAGRRATNAILKSTNHPSAPCYLRKRIRTGFGAFQFIDSIIYKIQLFFKSLFK